MHFLIKTKTKTVELESIINDVKRIKTKKELEEKIIPDVFLHWKGSECEDIGEQNVAFIEQRALFQLIHKNEITRFKSNYNIPGMKTRLEGIIPHFKLWYFAGNDNFAEISEIRQRFIDTIDTQKVFNVSERIVTSLAQIGEEILVFNAAQRLGLEFLVCVRWVDEEIEKLIRENLPASKVKILMESWMDIKPYIGSKYDEIFVVKDEEELEEYEEIFIEDLENELKKILSEIQKKTGNDYIPDWVNELNKEERKKKFKIWRDNLRFNTLKKQLEKRDAWIKKNNKKKGFGIELREGRICEINFFGNFWKTFGNADSGPTGCKYRILSNRMP